jgi:hypothetical protein
MLTFNSELFCRLLIGLLLGFLLHYKTCKNQFYIINQKIDQIIDKIEPRKSQLKNKINQLTDDKKYSQEIENLRITWRRKRSCYFHNKKFLSTKNKS